MLLLPNKPQKEIGSLWDTRQDGGEKRETGEENTQEKEGTFLFCFVFKYTKYLMKSENRREEIIVIAVGSKMSLKVGT